MKPAIDFFAALFQALMTLVLWVIWLCPLGVFFLVSWTVGKIGLAAMVASWSRTALVGWSRDPQGAHSSRPIEVWAAEQIQSEEVYAGTPLHELEARVLALARLAELPAPVLYQYMASASAHVRAATSGDGRHDPREVGVSRTDIQEDAGSGAAPCVRWRCRWC